MIQAQKLEIVDEQQPILGTDDTGKTHETEISRKELIAQSRESKLNIHTPPQKRKRGRPKKNRAGGRKRRSLEKPKQDLSSEHNHELERSSTTSLKNIPSVASDSSPQFSVNPAVPLTVNSDSVHGIVLTGNYPQGETANKKLLNKGAISFFDALRCLIEDFNSDVAYSDQFKMHVLNTIDELRMKSTQLKKTASLISRIQKEKAQIRQRILMVKDQSKNVLMEMNELREYESKKKLEYEWIKSIRDQIEKLKCEIQGETLLEKNDLDTVEWQLLRLKVLFSPETGVVSKLCDVNEKLKEKEAQLSSLS